jgi:uncharacterized membrane protein YfhO
VSARPSDADPVAARVERRDAEHLSVTLDRPVSEPTLVVLLDHYDSRWQARAGDVEVPIRRVNGAFRGVVVPAGGQRVDFEYAPWWDRIGAPVSLVLLVLLSAWAVAALILERRRQPAVPLPG